MKIISYLLYLLIIPTFLFSCQNKAESEVKSTQFSNSDKIEVIYFHFERRCATCNAVENVSRKTVTNYFVKKANFTSYNIDEESGKKVGEELGINSQALIIIFGKTKIDITSEGFLYAKQNPEKLESIIKEKINGLL